MSKTKKNTAKYQNPDDAPINYSEEPESKDKLSDRVETSNNEILEQEPSVLVDSSVKDESNTNVKNANSKSLETVSMKSSVIQDIPESAFTNYIGVRIVGRHKLAGKRMMSPITIANMVMEGSSDYCILVSSQTARLIRKIIMNYGCRLNNKNVSIERKEQMLTRFENNLKKFKF